MSGQTEILHALIGMVVLLLLPLCITQVRRPEFPARDKEVLKIKYIYMILFIYIYIFVGISQADRAGLDKALKGEILE